jgi:hypothetical protein
MGFEKKSEKKFKIKLKGTAIFRPRCFFASNEKKKSQN